MLTNMAILSQNESMSRNSNENRKNPLDNSLENKKHSSECSGNTFFSECYSPYDICGTDRGHFVNVQCHVPTLFSGALQSIREGSDFAL